ncbi:MAG TPA: RDD family protein [Steroidobacteraceae bacterium]|nr:RDD family protein [Steroidobacteraceae bacterium]
MPRPHAPVLRGLAAAVYDGLLLGAVLFLVTALLLVATHGEAITAERVGAWVYGYQVLLAAVTAGYFGVSWTRRGQTLGMKAWGLRLETAAGGLPGWRAVLLRLACATPLYLALVGAALLFIAHRTGWPGLLLGALPLAASLGLQLLTGGGTLPDRLSGTRIVRDAAG